MGSAGHNINSTIANNVTLNSLSVMTEEISTNFNYVLTKDIILWKLNEKEFDINFPCMVCLIFAIAIGVIGNACVIYVFGFRLRRNNTNLFTTWLSVYDLMTCFLLVFEVFDKRFPMYSGKYVGLCKTIRLFVIITNSSSAFLLLGIAFDRYFKVCTPLKRMSVKTSRRVIIAGLISPLICVWPMAIFHGPEKKLTAYTGIYGVDCADDDAYVDTTSRKVFYTFLVLVIISSIIILFVLYVRIFIAIRKWKRFGDTFSHRRKRYDTNIFRISMNTENDTMSTIRVDDEMRDAGGVFTMTDFQTHSPSNQQHQNLHSTSLQLSQEFADKESDRFRNEYINQNGPKTSYRASNGLSHSQAKCDDRIGSSRTRASQNGPKTLYRGSNGLSPLQTKRDDRSGSSRTRAMGLTTFMFLLVSILYVCSFLPTVTVEALNALKVINYDGLSFTEKKFIVIANISYFLNGSFNPVIYVSCNKYFRSEIKNMINSP